MKNISFTSIRVLKLAYFIGQAEERIRSCIFFKFKRAFRCSAPAPVACFVIKCTVSDVTLL